MSSSSSLSNKKWMITSVLLIIIFIVYIIIYPPGQREKVTLAEVNGVTISKDQLYNSLYSNGGDQALQLLIENVLIQQEADKAGIDIKNEDVEKEFNKVKQSFSTEEEFAETLDYYGMTIDIMKEDLVVQLQLRKLLEPQITITDEQIQQYYTDNLEMLSKPEEIKAAHILVATKEEAEAILTQLRNGKDFAEAAKEKSIDTATKDIGGDLGFITAGINEESFDTAAFALEIGNLSEVVETSEGFHIIKVLSRNAEIIPSLEETKADIRETIMVDEVSKLAPTWLEEKKSESSIKIIE